MTAKNDFVPGEVLKANDLDDTFLAKADKSHTHTAAQISDSTPAGRALLTAANEAIQKQALHLAKADVGLPNVDNTADAVKPVSSLQQEALDGKAALQHGHAGEEITSGAIPSARFATTLSAAIDTMTGAHAEGDLLFRSAAGWVRLPSGPSGYQLTSTGPGALPLWSAPTTAPAGNSVAPVNTAKPTITPATAQQGQLLTLNPGTWTGTPYPSFLYQWYVADTNAAISGATSVNYTPQASDVGHFLRCDVTAYNAAGSLVVASVWTDAVLALNTASAPGALSIATISGTVSIGTTLTANNGSWTGAPAPTFTYQWAWADANAPIAGATSTTYVPVAADYGHTLKVSVTGTNASGSQTIASAATIAVPGIAPSNSAQPTLSTLVAIVGQGIDGTPGTWNGVPAPTFAFQWYYGDTGTAISGATGSSYTPTQNDVGHQLSLGVTATNVIGSATAFAPFWTNAVTSNTQATKPAPTASPIVTGTAQVGSTLSVSTGSWSGTPAPAFTYQWFWADTGAAISGATDKNYAPVSGDVGHTLKAVVTGTNTAGSASATSNTTSAVTAASTNVIAPVLVAAPVISGTAQQDNTLAVTTATWSETPVAAPTNSVAPSITGTLREGQTLTAATGSWTGAPSFAFAWLRGGVAISGATSSTYVPVGADIGANLSVRVTGTNSGGSLQVTSAAVGPIVAAIPANTVLPAITGTTTVGQTLTCSTGTWTSSVTVTYFYQWTKAGVNIAGATSSTYVLVSGDAGSTIACVVTASNAGGTANTSANSTAVVSGGSAVTLPLSFTGGSLPANVTALGGANATRVDSTGNVVAATAPRFDYNPTTHAALGILVEPTATNSFAHSSDPAAWDAGGVVGMALTSNAATGPDGTTSAGKLAEDTSTGIHIASPGDVAYDVNQVAPVYAKAGTSHVFQMTPGSAASTDYANFDLNAGTSSASAGTAGMDAMPNGWYRCWWSITGANGVSNPLFLVLTNDNASATRAPSYTGTGKYIYIWDVEFVGGVATRTSAIPTTTTSRVRSADAVSFTLPGGTTSLTFTFDDNSTQTVSGLTGGSTYTIPTTLNRSRIKSIA